MAVQTKQEIRGRIGNLDGYDLMILSHLSKNTARDDYHRTVPAIVLHSGIASYGREADRLAEVRLHKLVQAGFVTKRNTTVVGDAFHLTSDGEVAKEELAKARRD